MLPLRAGEQLHKLRSEILTTPLHSFAPMTTAMLSSGPVTVFEACVTATCSYISRKVHVRKYLMQKLKAIFRYSVFKSNRQMRNIS